MTVPQNAFAYRDYRIYWFSALLMVFAMQFRFIAAGWLVHLLKDSPFWLGVPGIISAVTTIGLTVPAGALADRFDSRILLIVSRFGTGLAHGALAWLVYAGQIEIWMILVWSVIVGALGAVSSPANAALLPRVIERPAMQSAVVLNSSIWNSMRVIGPAGAGVMLATLGVAQAFTVTSAGFLLSAALLVAVRAKPVAPRPPDADDSILSGLRYVFHERVFLSIIGLSFFSSMFGRSYFVLLPVFADHIVGGGETTYGLMEAAAGVGGLTSTLLLLRRRIGARGGRWMTGSAVLFGIALSLFASSESLWLSLVMLGVGAFFSSVYLNVGMTALQLLVPDHLRGRVMGVWGVTWFLSSAGGFFAGTLAELIGTPEAVAFGALAVAAFGAFVWFMFPEMRRLVVPDTG